MFSDRYNPFPSTPHLIPRKESDRNDLYVKQANSWRVAQIERDVDNMNNAQYEIVISAW